MSRAAAALAAALAFAAPARAVDAGAESSTWPSGAPIRDVRVERLNVFDPAVPGEGHALFRLANRIHFTTREPVVRRELLFGPGDPWDPFKVLESERNLRANGSFRRAEIVPVRREDGAVDAEVRTQDAWTTNIRAGGGTEGGESFYAYGIEEANLLGLGKSVGYIRGRYEGRDFDAVSYGDPRFLGSRLRLGSSYVRAQEGDSNSVALARPFYALDAGGALSLSWRRLLADLQLRRDGEDFTKFRERSREIEGSAGVRVGELFGAVHRAEAGWYHEKASFESRPATAPGTLPAGRELSGPTAGWSWVVPRYVKETYLDRMERVEDFNMGSELSLRAGWTGTATGSDRDRPIFRARQQQGLRLAPGRLLLAAVSVSGRTAGGKWENGLLTAAANAFWKTGWLGGQTFVAHVEGAAGRSLDSENQVILGGATGLRGYRNDSFVGDKAVLLNLEDRFFVPGEFFHLARFGGAVFFDTGAVAVPGEALSLRRLRSDIGAGLRASPTRSRSGGVARVDVAYALNDGPGRGRWVVSIRAGQAFSLFNSASSRVAESPASRLQ